MENRNVSLFGITEGIICQQVNCCGVMGAGLARAIMDQFPIVKESYDECYRETANDKGHKCHFNQLGSVDIIPLDITDMSIKDKMFFNPYDKNNKSRLMVANIYAQDFFGNPDKTGKVYTKLYHLTNAIHGLCLAYDMPIYVPKGIGCGYGGETWDHVYKELQELADKFDNLYLLDTFTQEVSKIEPVNELEMER